MDKRLVETRLPQVGGNIDPGKGVLGTSEEGEISPCMQLLLVESWPSPPELRREWHIISRWLFLPMGLCATAIWRHIFF